MSMGRQELLKRREAQMREDHSQRQDVTTRETTMTDAEFRKMGHGAFTQAMQRRDGSWAVDLLLQRAPEPAPPAARHTPPPAPALPKREEPAPEPRRRIPVEAFRC